MNTWLCVVFACLLDGVFGETRRFHPLVGFGWLAQQSESIWRRMLPDTPFFLRLAGVGAWLCLIVPLVGLVACLVSLPERSVWWIALESFILYLTLGIRSLHEHAMPVLKALLAGEGERARHHAAWMVSRDRETLDPAKAAVESVLENGNDAVFAALFWFIVAGAPGAVLYRLANTLDAMWGYRNHRYRDFGWASARLDDALNFIPARLTALTYALCGHTAQALRCWFLQGRYWASPNAGPVMAAGAGALRVELGGRACYQGCWHERPLLGVVGMPVEPCHIAKALQLVRYGVLLWLVLWLLMRVLFQSAESVMSA